MTETELGPVLLSGASGMLGLAIRQALALDGVPVRRLVRGKAAGPDEIQWDPSPRADAAGLELSGMEGIRAAVHLSGANVAGRRWTKAYKQEMWESRVNTTRVLAEGLARRKALAGSGHAGPEVLITASGTGFYGDRGEEILDEGAASGTGFLAELCQAWEGACAPAAEAGIRVAHLRFGMVIGPDGGAMARLKPLFRMGLGGRLGNGQQWMSWVSEADAVGAALFALREARISGGVNVVAPEAVRNAEFTRELGRAVHRPAVMPAPAFALRLAFGAMADEALLASQRVVPGKLTEARFGFAHPTLASALAVAV